MQYWEEKLVLGVTFCIFYSEAETSFHGSRDERCKKKHSFFVFCNSSSFTAKFHVVSELLDRLHTPSQYLYPTRKSLSASDDTGFKTETAALSLALTRCRFWTLSVWRMTLVIGLCLQKRSRNYTAYVSRSVWVKRVVRLTYAETDAQTFDTSGLHSTG